MEHYQTAPLLHQTIKHSKGKGKYVYKYNLLIDGVHGNPTAKANWAKSIQQAVVKNRNIDSDDDESEPKKGWRKERQE